MDDQQRASDTKSLREMLAGVDDRVADGIRTAWEDAGVGSDGRCSWPNGEERTQLTLDGADDPAGLDLFAAVLDETPRTPVQVALHVDRGRRDDLFDGVQDALELLAANADVTATAGKTSGTAPATDETLDALAWLYGEGLERAVVLDERGEPIADYREWAVVVSIPGEALERVRASLDASVSNRFET